LIDPGATALAVARGCGVTRLADVTGLDRIGLPVWQAVRPWARSLSVHQGKGVTAAAARLGACMEAIECSHAENWSAPLRHAALDDLPDGERALVADDFAVRRGAVADDQRLDWVAAERLGGGVLWVPAAAVSLDLVAPGPPGITRSSNGQGAGFDLDFASLKALCEVIERDAYTQWMASRTVFNRGADEIDLAGGAAPASADLLARCTRLGIAARAYALPSVIAMPVIAVELHDQSGEAASHPHAVGTAAHPDAAAALLSALTEAIQARLTVIAGARDDLQLGRPEARPPSFGLAIAASGVSVKRPLPTPPVLTFAGAIAALAAAGHDRVARLLLSPPDCPVVTVKMFVPGLGESRRLRRSPA
jgi:ribosomal protein S12 methylthiotransferase accessory factor